MSAPTTGEFLNQTTPPASTGDQTVVFQSDGATPLQSITAVPKRATGSLMGTVKPDGTTIVIAAGVITAVAAGGAQVLTANYTAVTLDANTLLTFNSPTPVTLLLPAVPPAAKWKIAVENIGAGVLTVDRNGLLIDTVAANLTLNKDQGLGIYTDGTNYFTERGLGGGAGSTTVIALAPSAPGNFTVAHGLGVAPLAAFFQPTSGGQIWFQTPLLFDATNLYLVASDAGVTGDVVLVSSSIPLPAGGVTSVAISMPAEFAVSGSPVTSTGTFAVTKATQSANTFYRGPTSGSPAVPIFGAIVPADLPVMVASGGSHAAGAVPDPGASAGTTKFLREDATFAVPPGGVGGGLLGTAIFSASTGAITNSYFGGIVTGVTRVGVGQYNVAISPAQINISVHVTPSDDAAAITSGQLRGTPNLNASISSIPIQTNTSSSLRDPGMVSISIFKI